MEAFLFLVADWLSAIQCQDTPYQDIAAIVEFMYRGEINVSQVLFRLFLQYSINIANFQPEYPIISTKIK
jgi:hypothetical protein